MPRATPCWQAIARELMAHVRGSDVVGRQGGDELA
jgi:GGDEF domain-containing protein